MACEPEGPTILERLKTAEQCISEALKAVQELRGELFELRRVIGLGRPEPAEKRSVDFCSKDSVVAPAMSEHYQRAVDEFNRKYSGERAVAEAIPEAYTKRVMDLKSNG